MIKPATLWALCKTCEDSKWIGDICRALGGQQVELDFGQRQYFKTIQQDSEWMDERIEWEKERQRKRTAECRARKRMEQGVTNVTVTPVTSECNGDVTPSLRPSVPPSVPPKHNNTDTVSTVKSGRIGVDISGIDPYSMDDGRLFSGEFTTITLYRAALGEGFWWKAINELGDETCLGELVKFIHEVHAGEVPRNAGAVMTKRLKKLMEAK